MQEGDIRMNHVNQKIINAVIEKAEKILGWIPSYSADTAIKETVEWYKHFYAKSYNMYDFTMKQIKVYEESIKWNKSCATK